MEEEIWKDIPGWEGLYQASSLGGIRSLRFGRIKIMYAYRRRKYDTVTLSRNGVMKTYSVHVLIALTFHDKPGDNYEVDHIDGNSKNNRADNLRWVTCTENHNNPITVQRYREAYYRTGADKVLPKLSTTKEVLERRGKTYTERYSGENSPRYGWKHSEEVKRKIGLGNKGTCMKPVIQASMDGSFIKEWPGGSYAARELGICAENISSCCLGKSRSAGGYRWFFKTEYNG